MENPDNAVETTPMLGGNTENRQLYENHKRSRWWSRIKYYIPILSWLPQYSLSNLKFDILSGLTISFVLIPQGLSYAANLIKINPIYGLYSCIVPVIVYLFLGTSRQISIGPEAVISIMTGSTITEYIRRNAADFPEDIDIMAERAQLAFLITAIVGILTLIFGLFRLGFLDSVLSRALLTGFTSAVATVIIFEQIPLLLGITSTCDITSPLEKFIYIIKNYTEKESHTITMYISLACLLFLIIVSIIKKIFSNRLSIQRIPEVLLLVGSSIAISYYYDWENLGVKVLGKINQNVDIKHPYFNIKRVNGLFVPSLLIAVVGFVEALIITKKYSSKYKYSVSPNRELVAFGSLNIIGSFFGACPTYASLSRSSINDRSFAKSQISGVLSAGIIYLTIKYLLPYFEYLAVPVMASVISVAALGLIEIHDIIYFFKVKSYSDILLMLLIYFTTVIFSISDGILISVSLSLLLVVKHTTIPRLKVLGKYKTYDRETGQEIFKFKNVKKYNNRKNHKSKNDNDNYIDDEDISDEEDQYDVEQIEGVLIISFGDNLFFGNTGQLKERFRRIEVYRQTGIHPGEDPRMLDPDYENHPIQEIILDFENVGSIDACATQIISEIIDDYHQRNIGVSIVRLNEECRKQFKNAGLYGKIDFHRYFNKISDCLDALAYYVPGLPNGLNWRESEGIVYLKAHNIVHDGTSISWEPISNIWGESLTPIESNGNMENYEDSFIRYRIHRKSSAFISSQPLKKDNLNISIDQHFEEPNEGGEEEDFLDEPIPSTSGRNLFKKFKIPIHKKKSNAKSNITKHAKTNLNNNNNNNTNNGINNNFNNFSNFNNFNNINNNNNYNKYNNTNNHHNLNSNDSFNLMNNSNVWRNDSEANNISLNFDLPNQFMAHNTDDFFNQTNVWDTKSTKSTK